MESGTDNGTPITLSITSTGPGHLSAVGADANFSSISIIALGAPAVPSPALVTTALAARSVATGTDMLDILVTQTGLSVPAGLVAMTNNYVQRGVWGARAYHPNHVCQRGAAEPGGLSFKLSSA